MKVCKSLRFDEDLWKEVTLAAKKTKRSATAYLEFSAEEQLKRDADVKPSKPKIKKIKN